MIDFELFKKILSQEEEGFIEPFDFIDKKMVDLFLTSRVEKVKKLFKKCGNSSVDNPFTYKIELVCEHCGKTFVKEITKTKFFEILTYMRGKSKYFRYRNNFVLCELCSCDLKKIKEEQEKTNIVRREIAIKNNTESYINNYLNPQSSWKEGVRTWDKIQSLSNVCIDKTIVMSKIKSMDYKDFLKTPYWKAIAEKIRFKAGNKCQICNSSDGLNVHHRTYEHHGDELHHMDDLICLCHRCHQNYHSLK